MDAYSILIACLLGGIGLIILSIMCASIQHFCGKCISNCRKMDPEQIPLLEHKPMLPEVPTGETLEVVKSVDELGLYEGDINDEQSSYVINFETNFRTPIGYDVEVQIEMYFCCCQSN